MNRCRAASDLREAPSNQPNLVAASSFLRIERIQNRALAQRRFARAFTDELLEGPLHRPERATPAPRLTYCSPVRPRPDPRMLRARSPYGYRRPENESGKRSGSATNRPGVPTSMAVICRRRTGPQRPVEMRWATEKKSSVVPDFLPMLMKMLCWFVAVFSLGMAVFVTCESCTS